MALTVLVPILVMTAGCGAYRSREVSFRHPSAFANLKVVDGAQLAAVSHADAAQAREVFGFDIRAAGLLPVQVVIDNAGQGELRIVPEQTFLIDGEGAMWGLLAGQDAYERLEKSAEYSRIVSAGGKGALLGAAGGALIGAAIGVLSGENVGTALVKGAAAGGAGGAVLGGFQGAADEDVGRRISRDLARKELRNHRIAPGNLAHGFLFFPGEAPSAKTLRLQVENAATNSLHTLFFQFP
ncbi:MAG: hypothetical protein JXB25_08375 [Deltaproteobacteria bacterium]|nr:hypothetical protein [Deltaproteobacteria bacterium]